MSDDYKDQIEEVTRELMAFLDDMPPPTEEDLNKLTKWMEIEITRLQEMEAEIGIAGVMTILTRIISSVVVARNVPIDRFTLGMTLAYIAAKEQQDEDNMTPSQSVH